MRLVQRPPEPLDMRLTMSHITATFLGAESICPPLEASDGIFSIQDIIRLSYGMTSSCQHYFLAHSALSPPCLCFSSCNSSQQPSPSHGTSSHSPGALPCTCACLHPVFRLMTAAEGLPAAFQGANASLPLGHFSVDTG